jgi:hypothetical protein
MVPYMHSYRMFFDTRGAYENIKEILFNIVWDYPVRQKVSMAKSKALRMFYLQSLYFSFIYIYIFKKSHV